MVLFPASPQAPPATPASLTARQDRQRLLDLLQAPPNHRPPLLGSPPLVLRNGRPVAAAAQWWKQRRPQIIEDFDREVYGRVPKLAPYLRWETTGLIDETVGGIAVLTKRIVGHVDNSAYPRLSVAMQLTLTTPAAALGPVPIVLVLDRTALHPTAPITIPESDAPGPVPPSSPDWRELVLAKGWGYAVLLPDTLQADNGEGLTQGIIGLLNRGQPRKLDDWGVLRAWAWGASRALDYFETNPGVDARRVALAGHDHYAHAVAVAFAYDPRFAVALVSSSGEGGLTLPHGNESEYHRLAGNFLKFAGAAPVHAPHLLALGAPRPVFLGTGPGEADAREAFLAAVAAGPVYRLLGKSGLAAEDFPPLDSALLNGGIAFRRPPASETAAPHWPSFLDFASRYFTR